MSSSFFEDLKGLEFYGSGESDTPGYVELILPNISFALYGERLIGGDDILDGTEKNDIILGLGGDDTLSGLDGNDALFGGFGADFLKGNAGNDLLNGNSGDDFLDGGSGINVYIGDVGADTFVLSDHSFNRVNDFQIEQGDQLALDDGLKLDSLSFISDTHGTIIEANGEEIAFLAGVSEETIADNTDNIFTTVAASTLTVSFDQINLPETIAFGDHGSVTLEITNTSGHEFSGLVPLDLFISADDDQDSISDIRNDGLLNTLEIDVDLGAGESTKVEIGYENLSSVVAPGAYHLLAGVQGSELTSELVSAPGSDSVLTWHATAINAIQEFGEADNDSTGIGIVPTFGSRALAIIQTSVFNAANAFSGEYESYLGLDPGIPAHGSSIDAAVAGASVTALASVLPGTQDLGGSIIAQLESSLDLSTGEVETLLRAADLDSIFGPSTPGSRIASFDEPFLSDLPHVSGYAPGIDSDIVDGFLLGVNAASQILDARSDDGFTGYFVGIDDPGNYNPPVPVGFEEYIWTPEILLDSVSGESVFVDDEGNPVPFARSVEWGQLRSFSGQDIETFFDPELNPVLDVNGDGVLLDGRPFANGVDPHVDAFQQGLYALEINEVQAFGGLQDTDISTIARNQDQTDIAIFWAYDRPDTYRPYGQLHQIAQEAAFYNEGSLLENARTLALTGIALGDAAIAAWFNKYDSYQPRPSDVIAGDDGQGTPIASIDGIDSTVADLDWDPLLIDPPFPDYISGHSTFAGAFGGVLDILFPEATDIEVVSQEIVPGNGIFTTSDDELFNLEDFGPVRTFDSYGAIGFEDAISRIYGGVHVREATLDAVIIGNEIGDFVAGNLLEPVASYPLESII